MRRGLLIGLSLPLFLAIGGYAREDRSWPAGQAEAAASTEAQESAVISGKNATSADGHSSRNALDWAGTYSGVLPCASCPGIETVVTLNADGSYQRSLLYIDEGPTPEVSTGSFSWNETGNTVTLDAVSDEAQQYQVGENALYHLDRDGKRILSHLANLYVLQKHVNDARIEDQRWQLVELRGKPIEAGPAAKNAVLTLRAVDSVASGDASCNSFSGRYAIKSGNRISFGRNMAVTMMACPDMRIESEFLEVLQTADNYTVSDDGMLSLNRACMAPPARFVRVDDGE